MKAKHKKRINIFEACEKAAAILADSGFELRYQSSKTEARYFAWPGREHTIRVAAHRSKKSPIGMSPVVARITFFDGSCETPHHVAISDERFEHMIATAIGMYMMKSAVPDVSAYRGKRGTWEDGQIHNRETGEPWGVR